MKLHSLCLAPLALVFFAGIFAACSTPPYVTHCEDPGPILIHGKDTGFEFCMGGPDHRAKILECPILEPSAGRCQVLPGVSNPCETNADCAGYVQQPAVCVSRDQNSPCGCDFSCVSDADCGPGRLCQCVNPASVCVPALCRSDADCGAGRLCMAAAFVGCQLGFACTSELDECPTNLDCPEGSTCVYEGDHRVCSTAGCKR